MIRAGRIVNKTVRDLMGALEALAADPAAVVSSEI